MCVSYTPGPTLESDPSKTHVVPTSHLPSHVFHHHHTDTPTPTHPWSRRHTPTRTVTTTRTSTVYHGSPSRDTPTHANPHTVVVDRPTRTSVCVPSLLSLYPSNGTTHPVRVAVHREPHTDGGVRRTDTRTGGAEDARGSVRGTRDGEPRPGTGRSYLGPSRRLRVQGPCTYYVHFRVRNLYKKRPPTSLLVIKMKILRVLRTRPGIYNVGPPPKEGGKPV